MPRCCVRRSIAPRSSAIRIGGIARCTARGKRSSGGSPQMPRGGAGMSEPQVRPITILIAALGGEGGGVLTDWIVAAAVAARLSGAVDLDPRRRPAHRRHHLLHRDRAGAAARARRQAAGAGARTRRRRCRHRAGERADGSRPRHRGGLRHARSHPDDRLDRALLPGGGEDGDGRRPLRPALGWSRRSRTIRKRTSCSTWKRWPSRAAP